MFARVKASSFFLSAECEFSCASYIHVFQEDMLSVYGVCFFCVCVFGCGDVPQF